MKFTPHACRFFGFWAAVMLLTSSLTACSSVSSGQAPADGNPSDGAKVSAIKDAVGADSIAERYGIEVVALRSTASGHMIDFRYRVIDLEKAEPFFREDIKPILIDQKSGLGLSVPVPAKLGPLRPTGRNPKLGVTYWTFFGNPQLVKPGDKVTIVVGEYRIEDVVVE